MDRCTAASEVPLALLTIGPLPPSFARGASGEDLAVRRWTASREPVVRRNAEGGDISASAPAAMGNERFLFRDYKKGHVVCRPRSRLSVGE